jgi:hypothetical protein
MRQPPIHDHALIRSCCKCTTVSVILGKQLLALPPKAMALNNTKSTGMTKEKTEMTCCYNCDVRQHNVCMLLPDDYAPMNTSASNASQKITWKSWQP